MSQIHLLQYDIPETRVWSNSAGRYYSRPVMPNPSGRLWRAGAVRLTLSCWLIHEGSMPYTLVRDFKSAGVKWETAPFDMSAAESLAAMALNSIKKEIADYVARAKETRDDEFARIDALPVDATAADREKARRRYRRQIGVVAKRVRECLKRVQVAAERFGINADSIGVPDARNALDAIKAGMDARAEAFAKAHGVLTRKRGKGDAMATAIAADDVFGPVAADYLEESGDAEEKAVADQLRAAFGYDF